MPPNATCERKRMLLKKIAAIVGIVMLWGLAVDGVWASIHRQSDRDVWASYGALRPRDWKGASDEQVRQSLEKVVSSAVDDRDLSFTVGDVSDQVRSPELKRLLSVLQGPSRIIVAMATVLKLESAAQPEIPLQDVLEAYRSLPSGSRLEKYVRCFIVRNASIIPIFARFALEPFVSGASQDTEFRDEVQTYMRRMEVVARETELSDQELDKDALRARLKAYASRVDQETSLGLRTTEQQQTLHDLVAANEAWLDKLSGTITVPPEDEVRERAIKSKKEREIMALPPEQRSARFRALFKNDPAFRSGPRYYSGVISGTLETRKRPPVAPAK